MSSTENLFSSGSDYHSCFLDSNGSDFAKKVLQMKRKEYNAINQIHISDVALRCVSDV